jgi:hypothetical protein
MEHILAFVLGILIGAVIISLIYSVLGVLKINKQLATHKEYDDALSHNIDSVKDHLEKTIDDIKRDLRDEINHFNQELHKLEKGIFKKFDETELSTDNTIGKVIEMLSDNINAVDTKTTDVKKYVDSRIDKLSSTARRKPAVEYFTDEEIKQETQQLNS